MGSLGTCAGCGDALALHRGRPSVGGDGRVALWCAACWPTRGAAPAGAALVADAPRPPPVSAIEPPEPSHRRAPLWALSAAGLAILGVAAFGGLHHTAPAASTPAAPPRAAAPPVVPVAPAAAVVRPAPAPPSAPVPEPVTAEPVLVEAVAEAEPDSDAAAVTALDLATLDEERPSLRDWVHPVTGTDELVPVRGTRKFGARRVGLTRVLCGEGHCGVDLSGPRGRPVVAVAWGTVVRVEHSARGRDGRSGRYVRLEHPEGVFTSYMHLDAIAAELAVGDEVEAGQVLGTLGKTAIYHGEQHLHFGLELEERGALVHVDPTTFLARAQVEPVPTDELRLDPADRAQW